MEPLNLQLHDADEYEGKLVVINDAEYVVGPHMGTGAERTVHKLINLRSGICLFAIKFWHFQEEAHFFGEGGQAEVIARMRTDPMLASVVPISLFIEAHGGAFEVQALSGYEYPGETPALKALMERATASIDGGDYTGARTFYAQILNSAPNHVVALHNLAAAHANLEDYDQASKIEAIAVEVEPNFILYRLTQMRYAGNAGNLKLALEYFGLLKEQFPYIHDADDLAIEVYLLLGDFEGGKRVLAEGMLSEERLSHWKDQIAAAESASKRAATMTAEAKTLLDEDQQRNDAAILRLLEEAHAIYDKDPWLTINLALALGRAGDHQQAVTLLASAMSVVPELYVMNCSANIAFNLIRMSQFDLSMTFLDMTLDVLETISKGQFNIYDLPGVAVWVEENRVIEERAQSASQLVDHALKNLSPQTPIPPGVTRLAALYREAAAAT
jgi:tetratricopeptide (TPR) repeat protein